MLSVTFETVPPLRLATFSVLLVPASLMVSVERLTVLFVAVTTVVPATSADCVAGVPFTT